MPNEVSQIYLPAEEALPFPPVTEAAPAARPPYKELDGYNAELFDVADEPEKHVKDCSNNKIKKLKQMGYD